MTVLTGSRGQWLLTAALIGLFGALALAPAASQAAPARHFTTKKAIWGPVSFNGMPQFPIYHDLGAGIWEYTLDWAQTAPTEPTDARNPDSLAYEWPREIDEAAAEAKKYGIRVSLLVRSAPRWANGNHKPNWVPKKTSDLADFVTAAARRYPSVNLWMIWGEPSRRANFMPLTPERRNSSRLNSKQAAAPRYYARMLDASYGALKAVRRSNRVIGGNTFISGDITPYNWVRYLRLPNGKPPRMDLYGHNPFTGRRPSRKREYNQYVVDFTDLPKFARFLDKRVRDPRGRKLKFFLSEFFWPTDHANHEFQFHLSLKLQASWLRDALRITEKDRRIYTLGWYSLYDDPPLDDGLEVNRGLLRRSGKKKPSYNVFRRG
jgi:hypothetical protein